MESLSNKIIHSSRTTDDITFLPDNLFEKIPHLQDQTTLQLLAGAELRVEMFISSFPKISDRTVTVPNKIDKQWLSQILGRYQYRCSFLEHRTGWQNGFNFCRKLSFSSQALYPLSLKLRRHSEQWTLFNRKSLINELFILKALIFYKFQDFFFSWKGSQDRDINRETACWHQLNQCCLVDLLLHVSVLHSFCRLFLSRETMLSLSVCNR